MKFCYLLKNICFSDNFCGNNFALALRTGYFCNKNYKGTLKYSVLFLAQFAKAQNNIQTEDIYKQHVTQVVSPLNTSIIPNGFLYECSFPIFPPSKLADTRLDSNHISLYTPLLSPA